MTFTESYKQNLDKTQLLSKIVSLLIIGFLALEIAGTIYEYLTKASSGWINENWTEIKIYLGFQIFIALVFAIRFSFLIKGSNFSWKTIALWIISWLSVFTYYLVTQKVLFGSVFAPIDVHCADCIYSMLFLWASKPVAILLFSYLLLSPTHQILHLIFAFFHRK